MNVTACGHSAHRLRHVDRRAHRPGGHVVRCADRDARGHPDEINRQVPAGFGAYKECDTTGTETYAGYHEHAYTWDVSLRTARILRARGVRVMLTRPDDNGVGPCRNAALARAFRDALESGSGMTTSTYLGTDGIYATDKFAGLNLATRPAAFLEIGNMRNIGDAALQTSPSGREQIAEALAGGILAYLARP